MGGQWRAKLADLAVVSGTWYKPDLNVCKSLKGHIIHRQFLGGNFGLYTVRTKNYNHFSRTFQVPH